ncbi:16S rRNA (adenine(1518)-N(6)/adenine(1519)-N(6))-dimethyltransferase RsmA [Candidatus Pseudoscillospira sp. SGI.172]|uniref:16S rRNA (adenine(1518)-N(6)/adenine(1519)-N(6))- dimethyltransferase RsmA n=1 Tax=Candidatus Pseudoscillospira sp. SGI.172 TaxID=3420582 RepID=UPI0009B9D66D|nr:16S rRNA (adenine(1518)-N(6)/adenine(1519)-N(6))-dimethyltransferase RsmA [Pseudoflavonifractor sp.]MDY3019723.1 16S rRNA (adenine(1518)-N(6)/adenine(1519)-N(6))-dimethyltransferase RsmA [Oscillospiraceae bacterium]
MDFYNINDIKALLARHGFRFSRSMGQNFLIESWVPRDVVEASGAGPGTGVLEIGPGIGPLTANLARRADKVVAVELDRSLLPILTETLADCPNVSVISADVMKLDLAALAAEHFHGLTPLVCANLPYNITTPVLTALLESGLFAAITVLVQKEVAQRICSAPGKGNYGAFSIFCQYHADTELLFDVPKECFLPAPKVTSAVLRLTPHPAPACVHDEEFFFRVIAGAFSQRRKTLLNALSSAFPLSKEELRECIDRAGLPADVRGERLSIAEFARLSDELQARLP